MQVMFVVMLAAAAISFVWATRERVIRCVFWDDNDALQVCVVHNRWTGGMTLHAVMPQKGIAYSHRMPRVVGRPPRDSSEAE